MISRVFTLVCRVLSSRNMELGRKLAMVKLLCHFNGGHFLGLVEPALLEEASKRVMLRATTWNLVS